jgi:hypothetical protein
MFFGSQLIRILYKCSRYFDAAIFIEVSSVNRELKGCTTDEMLSVEWRVCLSSSTKPSMNGQDLLGRGQFHSCLQESIRCIANPLIYSMFNSRAMARAELFAQHLRDADAHVAEAVNTWDNEFVLVRREKRNICIKGGVCGRYLAGVGRQVSRNTGLVGGDEHARVICEIHHQLV